MSIKPVNKETASASVNTKLEAVHKKLGFVPNLISTLANSEVALDAYLNLSGSLEKGELKSQNKERIALVTAHFNGCEYCSAAHSFLAQQQKVPNEDIAANGHSADSKIEALINFAESLLEGKGRADEKVLAQVRAAGYSDSVLLETVAHVSLNVLTNFANNLANTEIDFPAVDLGEAKVANK